MAAYSTRPLYGGAITCDIPSSYLDISDLRQVPDHQECFQSQDDKPTLLVVEILGREDGVSDNDVAEYFFKDLAESNGVTSAEDRTFHTISVQNSRVFSRDAEDLATLVNAGDNVVHLCAGIGFQKHVAMGRDFDEAGNSRRHLQEMQNIRVDLVVFRLLQQETDLLATVSTPMSESSDTTTAPPALEPSAMSPIILQAVSTLKVQDWGLFG